MTAANQAANRRTKQQQAAAKKREDRRTDLLSIKERVGSDPAIRQKWRAAHELATQVLDRDNAAIIVSNWFPDSISGSTPARIKTMLRNRGVSTRVQRQIIDGKWGKGTYAKIGRRGPSILAPVGNALGGRVPAAPIRPPARPSGSPFRPFGG